MAQNTSPAVMAQRREPKDALDDFPTPPWATRALCEFLLTLPIEGLFHPDFWVVREPAANRGYMLRPLLEYFRVVHASDVADYGLGYELRDFLWPDELPEVHWTITNPPFRLADQFVRRARETSREGVAIFVRTAFLEGAGRYRDLFQVDPPQHILQFSERVVIHRGRVVEKGSSATAYCWLVWRGPATPGTPPQFHWVAPCRARLERPGDYAPHGRVRP
ncbi:hypothetical protein RGUI_2751 [Rhodovulum sp. P5]|uniref:hypothetical protein n=1 Tax=Rhodovulum sp. P5 TaxID=1564506 RepID=UPI0009C2C2CB|nr:hypothetical protein [Rhodovulum sp. P5]ARE40892.1 hypothetical protein RGUI_2751 [Rhodovulum sp. P5]